MASPSAGTGRKANARRAHLFPDADQHRQRIVRTPPFTPGGMVLDDGSPFARVAHTTTTTPFWVAGAGNPVGDCTPTTPSPGGRHSRRGLRALQVEVHPRCTAPATQKARRPLGKEGGTAPRPFPTRSGTVR